MRTWRVCPICGRKHFFWGRLAYLNRRWKASSLAGPVFDLRVRLTELGRQEAKRLIAEDGSRT